MVMIVNHGKKDDILQGGTPSSFRPPIAKFIRDLCWWHTENATFLETGILEVKAVSYKHDFFISVFFVHPE